MKKHIQKAIDLLGSQTALADAVGVNQSSVWNWLNRDKSISLERAIQIEEATRGKVLASDLCPKFKGKLA